MSLITNRWITTAHYSQRQQKNQALILGKGGGGKICVIRLVEKLSYNALGHIPLTHHHQGRSIGPKT